MKKREDLGHFVHGIDNRLFRSLSSPMDCRAPDEAIGPRQRPPTKAAQALPGGLHDEWIATAGAVVDPNALGLKVPLDRLHAVFPAEA
jgi:hypothetical protein